MLNVSARTRRYFGPGLPVAVEAQACRAIGDLGLVKFHIATTAPVRRKPLLDEAIDNLEERVAKAEALQENITQHGDVGHYRFAASIWRSLGLGHLTLCYTALGEHAQALQYGRAAVESATPSPDPVIRGISRFYYGHALLAAGEHEEARRQWDFSAKPDLCTSVIALCREPSDEHCRWLRTMRDLKIRFDRHDQHGYTALDYAVLAKHDNCSAIILRGLRDQMDRLHPEEEAEVDRQVNIRKVEAERRKQYRDIFQLTFRPLLAKKMPGTSSDSCLIELRNKYTNALKMDLDKREVFDNFKYISYAAFKSLGKLPKPNSTEDMEYLREHAKPGAAHEPENAARSPYVVFFSYEWRGKTSVPYGERDDSKGSQYKGMIDAIQLLLVSPPELTDTTNLSEDRIFMWLVSYTSLFGR